MRLLAMAGKIQCFQLLSGVGALCTKSLFLQCFLVVAYWVRLCDKQLIEKETKMKRPEYRDYVATAIPIEGYQISSGHIIQYHDIAIIAEKLIGLLRAFEMRQVTADEAQQEVGDLMKEVEDIL
jgi:hypothetical protein